MTVKALRKSVVMTKSSTVNYLKTIPNGMEIKAIGKLIEVKSERESTAEGIIYDNRDEVYVRTTGIYRTLSKEKARKLGLADDAMLDWFDEFIKY